jgi:hypothetical protein
MRIEIEKQIHPHHITKRIPRNAWYAFRHSAMNGSGATSSVIRPSKGMKTLRFCLAFEGLTPLHARLISRVLHERNLRSESPYSRLLQAIRQSIVIT